MFPIFMFFCFLFIFLTMSSRLVYHSFAGGFLCHQHRRGKCLHDLALDILLQPFQGILDGNLPPQVITGFHRIFPTSLATIRIRIPG